ncbi:MAG: LysM peptidoglycan-binding domain-containing protein [Anaerolineales bacterium]|nr:LysM peptidoglycan-binding domain-containing protein [Anaerolineales bacterium]
MNDDIFSLVDPMETFDSGSLESSELDDLNHEPGSFLERILDYSNAEAIQTLFTSLLENLVEAFKGAFQEYLDSVETEPQAFVKGLQDPLKEIPVFEKSEASKLIRENSPVEQIYLSRQDETVPESAETPKLERTILTEHTVAEGEMLSSLALRYYGRAELWPLIHEANRSIIGDNPGTIFPGQTLDIPTLESGAEPLSVVLEATIPPLVLKSESGLFVVQNSGGAAQQPLETAAIPAPDSSEIETGQENPGTPETSSGSASDMGSDNLDRAAPELSENQIRLKNLDPNTALTDEILAETAEELTGEKLTFPTMRTFAGLGDLVLSSLQVIVPIGASVADSYLSGGDTVKDSDRRSTADDEEYPVNVLPADIIPIDMIQDDYTPPAGDISDGEPGEIPALPASAIPIDMIIDAEDRQGSGDSDYSSYDTRPEIPPPDEVLGDGTMVWHDGSRPDFEGGDMFIKTDGTIGIEF